MSSTDHTDFELQKSENQELSFTYLEELLSEQNIVLDNDTMVDLGIKYNACFTNLAHWISDQNDKCTIIAEFSNKDRDSALKRTVLRGSILKQMNDALDHITKHNKIIFRINNMKRVETSVFPPDAIRECLENAFIHADYSSEAMMMFSIYPDRIEFVSPGGMLTQFDMNDLACGVSSLRNKTLSRLMVSLKYSAMAGTRMPIIMNSYRRCHSKPTIYSSATIFKIQGSMANRVV